MLFSLPVFLDYLNMLVMEAMTFSKFKTGHLLGLEMRNNEGAVFLPSARPTGSVWIWVYCPICLLLSSSYRTFMDVSSGDTNMDPFDR